MVNFKEYVFNRLIWIALFEQKELIKGFDAFNLYIDSLKELQKNEEIATEAKIEEKMSKLILLNKLTELLDKFFDEKDYANTAICGNLLIKIKAFSHIKFFKFKKAMEELGQKDLAYNYYLYVLEHFSDDVSKLSEKAKLCAEMQDWEKAIFYMEKHINSQQTLVTGQDYNLLGCWCNSYYSDVKRDKDILKKSLESFKKAYSLDKQVLYAKNVTIMAGKSFDNETSNYYWNEIINNFPMSNDDKYDYAAHCLKTADFDNYHKYFDARFKKENNATPFPKIDKPFWNGQDDISDKILLVHHEQGFGDTFLTYGYIPRLIEKCKKIIFVVQDSIEPLLKNNEYGIEILKHSEVDLEGLVFDYYIPSMSIATTLKYTRENIGVGGGYIKANSELVKEFKEKYFQNNKFKIGISCSGNRIGNKTRDVAISELLELDNLENVELYYINKDADEKSFEKFVNNKINNIAKDFRNFADTAAAIENLDLVLCTDNGLLNLAGALGKKTFALFNYDREFRWFDLSGENVVYYDSVKPFLNNSIDDWQSSIQKAIDEIKILTGNF